MHLMMGIACIDSIRLDLRLLTVWITLPSNGVEIQKLFKIVIYALTRSQSSIVNTSRRLEYFASASVDIDC